MYIYGVRINVISNVDCVIVNRRTVTEDSRHRLSFGGAQIGQSHPGLDCFIFPAKWIALFERSLSVIGAGMVMRSLLLNLACLSHSMLVLTEANLTFHFGNDRPWLSSEMKEYELHNKQEAFDVYRRLSVNAPNREKLEELFRVQPKYDPR